MDGRGVVGQPSLTLQQPEEIWRNSRLVNERMSGGTAEAIRGGRAPAFLREARALGSGRLGQLHGVRAGGLADRARRIVHRTPNHFCDVERPGERP